MVKLQYSNVLVLFLQIFVTIFILLLSRQCTAMNDKISGIVKQFYIKVGNEVGNYFICFSVSKEQK